MTIIMTGLGTSAFLRRFFCHPQILLNEMIHMIIFYDTNRFFSNFMLAPLDVKRYNRVVKTLLYLRSLVQAMSEYKFY